MVVDGNVLSAAMMYVFMLAISAGAGLLVAAFIGYKLFGWYQGKQNKKVKRRGA